MSDSSLIINALITKLSSDTTLLAMMPNGVYEDQAPAEMTRFVIVSQILSQDTGVFQHRAFEDALVLIEARAKVGSGSDVQAAAAYIDALLDPPAGSSPATATLDVAGYRLMEITREEFIRAREYDEQNLSIVWRRCGGRYRVRCCII